MSFRDPIGVPRIENRVPRIRENRVPRIEYRIPRIRENRVPRIRGIGSLQVHTGHLTFSLKKTALYRCWTSRACTYTWREMAQFVWKWHFTVCCARSWQALQLWSELTNNTFRKQRRDTFFTLKFECHNRYNKLLLCNSENGDTAWCNKNNSQWGFCVFLKKNKNLFLFKKEKSPDGLFFFKNPGFS